jgi:rubrerythrin
VPSDGVCPPGSADTLMPTDRSVGRGHEGLRGGEPSLAELTIPKGGLIPAPTIPQPNIFPIEWRVETQKLGEIYERAKRQVWNPSDITWHALDPERWSHEERIGIMYWFAVLANFDASGPPVFAHATVQAFEQHQEDPVRKCFFSIARDEVNHEEVCQRVVQRLVPGGPLDWEPRTDLERAAHNNIAWLYHNGGRYWNGFERSFDKYPLAVVFTSFMMGEVASSTLFRGMASGTKHDVFREIFTRIGRDESRHLQICLTILETSWPGLTDDLRTMITKQLRAGFVFLSMVLWEPPDQFWQLTPYFMDNHRALMDLARQGGLGVLSRQEQAQNWRLAMARVRKIVERWGIEFPAIPELDIEGVDAGDVAAEDIIPVF